MKINRETKVGLLTIVALAMLIMGFNYLKGKDIFNTTKKVYAIFPKLGSLVKSNEVKINGLTIGTVYDLEEVDKNVRDRKSTRLNSSHSQISYAVFCLKKKKKKKK